jgi:hypothetical protein
MNAARSSPPVLVVAPDPGSLASWLHEAGWATNDLHFVADLPAAHSALAARHCFELALVFEPHPGQIADSDVALLRHTAPLVRFIALSGPACDGQLRTGRPWSADLRLQLDHGPAALRAAVADWRAGRLPPWSSTEPGTTALRPLRPFDSRIDSPDDRFADTLRRRLERLQPPARGPFTPTPVVFLDAAADHDDPAATTDRLEHHLRGTDRPAVVVLANFPRAASIAAWRAAGAAVVAARTLDDATLAGALDLALAGSTR